jgi:glycosyltransferase involved in cell wall biosynthesis
MKPELSIIIASYNSEKTIEQCLRSLKNQATNNTYEIIVVDSSTDNTARIIKERFSEIKIYTFERRKFPGDARNLGISMSHGRIIAFIDADCIADRNWVAEILKAHQSAHTIIGGVIANGNPDNYISWAAYFCEFSQWMPQLPQGKMVEIPTCCLSLKRWIFDKYGPFLERTYCEDTAFHWKLRKDGHMPILIPYIKVSHINVDKINIFLKKEFIHGRYFARVRTSELQLSFLQQAVFIMISPLLPFLLFLRITKRVCKNRIYLKYFVLSSPLVFCGLIMWSCGEFIGYCKNKKEKENI